MEIEYRLLERSDYTAVRRLWEECPEIGLSAADSEEGIALFLERNPGASFVALEGGRIVGSILCGFDGRRGYLYHLGVTASCRSRGIGTRLIESSLEALKRHGIQKCHLFVFETNELAIEFYRSGGWTERDDLKVFSIDLGA